MQSEDCLPDGKTGAGEAARVSDDRRHDGELRASRPPPLVLHKEEWSAQLILSL